MAEERCEGILLRTRETGESDLIVTFWTDQFGQMACRAPKARKSQKRFGGQLQSFSLLSLFFRRDRDPQRLPQLLRVEPAGARVILPEALDAFAAASFAGELVLRLTDEGDPNPALFELLSGYLDFCASRPLTHKILARFELRLLELLGFLPSWARCMECGAPLSAEASSRFDLLQGGLLCSSCMPIKQREAPRVSPQLRQALVALQAKKALDVTPQIWGDALELLDRRLCHVLGYETKSRDFLREISGL